MKKIKYVETNFENDKDDDDEKSIGMIIKRNFDRMMCELKPIQDNFEKKSQVAFEEKIKQLELDHQNKLDEEKKKLIEQYEIKLENERQLTKYNKNECDKWETQFYDINQECKAKVCIMKDKIEELEGNQKTSNERHEHEMRQMEQVKQELVTCQDTKKQLESKNKKILSVIKNCLNQMNQEFEEDSIEDYQVKFESIKHLLETVSNKK